MKRRWVEEEPEACALQMGPMMDCTFLLLLYFVSVSTINAVRISKEVRLPNTHQGIAEKDESGRFIIDVEWDEGLYEPTFKVGVLAINDPIDLIPMIEKSAKVSKSANFRVILRVDRQVPYEFTQQVMAAVADARVQNLLFSTVERDKAGRGG